MRRLVLVTWLLGLAGCGSDPQILSAGPDTFAVKYSTVAAAHAAATAHCAGLGKSPVYLQSQWTQDDVWANPAPRIYKYDCMTLAAKSSATTPAAFLESPDAQIYVARFRACVDEAYARTLRAGRSAENAETQLRTICVFYLKPLEPAMASLGGEAALDGFATAAIDDTLRRYRDTLAAIKGR